MSHLALAWISVVVLVSLPVFYETHWAIATVLYAMAGTCVVATLLGMYAEVPASAARRRRSPDDELLADADAFLKRARA